tara:strand:- start:6131 stop:6610 length:480 start_codon:yes stop_codon:yes gene_type:complete
MIRNRIGFGYDMHKLRKGNEICLGGIKINSEYSIVAHSDGDIILHALADAIFGALANGDIGTHFPSNDANYKINSVEIIRYACELLNNSNYKINNIDITIVIESPRLQKEISNIRKNISCLLDIDINQISIKSSTSQKIGLVGQNKAVVCYATILISDE